MKTIIAVLLIMSSFIAEAQVVILKLTDRDNATLLTARRGADIIMPTADGNAEYFFMPDVLSAPKFTDYYCLIDSLTEYDILVPLNDVVRFDTLEHRESFVNFLSANNITALVNNVGDIVLTFDIYELMVIQYPEVWAEVLSHGEHIDVFVRMQELDFIDIPFPETNTPIYTGCD